ncbi:aromatic ring-hydroxylating oxygenase subunit alpha [Chitinimonas lacunae]|uniref:Aromatic ring-hydroxylating dioxygenase subunit alpha n=1 Tax=Chitinimonas lacunae TaxID=1963018 RepID=A0ABV8MSJ6_9NEIS
MHSPPTDIALRDHYWHLLCHRQEVAQPNDFFRLAWLGQEVVVANDQDRLVVFDNVCPHRGARFFLDSAGNAPIVCKYHGWSYRNGSLNIPGRDHFEPCQLDGVDLNHYQVSWCGDFLFASRAPATSLDEQLGELFPLLERISRSITGRQDLNQTVYPCDWKIALENALEPYHVALVHRKSLGLLDLQAGVNTFHGINSVWEAPIGNSRMRRQLSSIRRFFDIDFECEGYISLYLFPFTMLSSTAGYSYSLQHFLPTAKPHETAFTSRLLVSRLAAEVPAETLESFFSSTAQMNRQVFDEDREVCARVVQCDDYMNRFNILSSAEEKIRHFRSVYLQAGKT